jgi:hypothetical protein
MFKLSKSQQRHLDDIVKKTSKRMRIKYIAGAKEHGGDLWDKDCLAEAFDEVIDLMTYLMTELKKRGKTK